MFPRAHGVGGSIDSPAHNLAEEWKVSGSGNLRLGYDPGAVLTVLIRLIFISAGFNTEAIRYRQLKCGSMHDAQIFCHRWIEFDHTLS